MLRSHLKTLLYTLTFFKNKETKLIENNDVIFKSFFYFCSNFKLHYSHSQVKIIPAHTNIHCWLFCFISALLSYVKQNGQQESIDINVQRRYFLWGIEELGSS